MISEHAGDSRILAGGTDLLVDLRRPIVPFHVPRCDGCQSHPEGNIITTLECGYGADERLMSDTGSIRLARTDFEKKSPSLLISLHRINELKKIELLDDGELKIGAMVTIRDIERSNEIRNGWTALSEGADNLGSPLVRNRGTIGGNIVNARPAADLAVPTIALGAKLVLKSAGGIRVVEATQFPTGPGASIKRPDEILIEIIYPSPSRFSSSAYYKLANRKALEISTVGVAVYLALEEKNEPVADVRISLGAVGPTPILAESVKDILIGKVPDENLLKKAARAARGDARPIDDHRGTAWYRAKMVELLAYRMLSTVLKRING
jgi:carbon-monoxide dehydrogenase medium subunit